MSNTNIVQQIMFTDTVSLLIKEKSIQNYAIIESDAPELEAITVSLWIKSTQNDTEVYFITYAASGSPNWKQNAFAIFTYNGQTNVNNSQQEEQSQQVRKHAFSKNKKSRGRI